MVGPTQCPHTPTGLAFPTVIGRLGTRLALEPLRLQQSPKPLSPPPGSVRYAPGRAQRRTPSRIFFTRIFCLSPVDRLHRGGGLKEPVCRCTTHRGCSICIYRLLALHLGVLHRVLGVLHRVIGVHGVTQAVVSPTVIPKAVPQPFTSSCTPGCP